MGALTTKSLTELRGIAQSFDIPDLFQKDKLGLIQSIEMKQGAMMAVPAVEIPRPEYDARLMLRPPAKKAERVEIEKLMQPYIDRGLRFTIDDNEERWQMTWDKRTDEGTLRMPLRHVLACADRIMR